MTAPRGILAAAAGMALGVTLMGCATARSGRILRLEAEDARLVGLEIATATPGFSGRGYVTGFDRDGDRLEVGFAATVGLYELSLRYHTPFGPKAFAVEVNGMAGGGMLAASGDGFVLGSAGKFLLQDGENTLVMRKGWGWFEVDAFEFAPATASPPLPVPAVLTDPRATPAARRLHAYLVELYGRQTLSGQQDLGEVRRIGELTGREPAVAALDFMDYSPSRLEHGATPAGQTEAAIEWVRSGGGILSYCWHWNAPCDLLDQPGGREWYKGFYSNATTFDLQAALADPAGERYGLLLRDLDAIAAELRKFAEADIPILWRPLHEAQGRWFWWGAKGPEPFVELWRLAYRRLTEHHGLHHLIWVYSPPGNGLTAQDWYPGDAWVDVIAPDIYAGRRPSLSGEWEAAQAAYGGRKLVALGECGDPPTPEISRAFQTRWSWFATWTGPFIRDVPEDRLRAIFNDEAMVTRDELPAWTRPGADAAAVAPEPRRTYRNPFIDCRGAADPTVLRFDGKYYLYPTTDGRGYDVFVSADLVHWERKPKCYTDVRGGIWAPDVFHHATGDGKVYLYYTADDPGGAGAKPFPKLVGVAVADHPLGPFADQGVLVKGAIDAHLFRDDDGALYLYYVRLPGGFRILVQRLADPLTPEGKPVEVIRPTLEWEKSHGQVTEGPWMLKRNGVYYLMYSGSGAMGPDYAIGYATASSPMGPFAKFPGNPIARRGDGIFGPGHHCTAEGPDGRLWLIYHQKNTTKVDWDRFLAMDPLWFDAEGVIHTRLSRGTDEPAP